MSGIVGVLHLDGDSVDEAALLRMNAAGRHRGPDGSDFAISGNAGVAHSHFDPRAQRNFISPYPIKFGHLRVVLDGLIHNRSDLEILAPTSRGIAEYSDSELIALAFQKWGTDCADYLIGEFAFVLWDTANRILFCARDALGVKPLHYFQDGSILILASEIRQLLMHPRVRVEPNEGMIAECVSFRFTSRSETLYRNIYRLPPGHCLSHRRGHTSIKQYWNFRPSSAQPNKSDSEYAEEFLSVFSEAIRCRLDDPENVGFDLSGGLDSSSIVCVANRVSGWATRLQAFSLGFNEQVADERAYIREVASFAGISSNLVAPVDLDLGRIQRAIARSRNFPGIASLFMHDPVCEQMRNRNMRVRITGLGGDQWLMGTPLHIADSLKKLEIRSAVSQARFDSRYLAGRSSSLKYLLQFGVFPLLPRFMRRGGKRLQKSRIVPFWIEPSFASKTHLMARLNNDTVRAKFPTRAQESVWLTANSGWFGFVTELVDEYDFSFGLETRHPFLDRRVVEFCIAIPEEQRWRGDNLKFVLRGAMKGILPEGVRMRRNKGDFTHIAAKLLLGKDVRQMLESLSMASLGWINQASVLRMYSELNAAWQEGRDYSRFVIPLSLICGVELWLKQVFDSDLNADTKNLC